MKEFKYVITDKEGIHARPAGELIKLLKDSTARSRLPKTAKKQTARECSLLWVLALRMVRKLSLHLMVKMKMLHVKQSANS